MIYKNDKCSKAIASSYDSETSVFTFDNGYEGKIFLRFNQKGEAKGAYIQAEDEAGIKRTFSTAITAEEKQQIDTHNANTARVRCTAQTHKPTSVDNPRCAEDYVGEVAENLCGAMATWTVAYNLRKHGEAELKSMRDALEKQRERVERYAEKVAEAQAITAEDFTAQGAAALSEQIAYERGINERREAERKREKAIKALMEYAGVAREVAEAMLTKKEAEAE